MPSGAIATMQPMISAQQLPIRLPRRAEVGTRCVMRDPKYRESDGIMTGAGQGCGISTRESA